MTRIADPITALSRPLPLTAGHAAGSPMAALFSGAAEVPATGLFALLLQEAAPTVPGLPEGQALPQPVSPPRADMATRPAEDGAFIAGAMLPRILPLPAGPARPEAVALPCPLPIPGEIPATDQHRATDTALNLPPVPLMRGEKAAEMESATFAPDPDAALSPAPAAAGPQSGPAQIGMIAPDHVEPGDSSRPATKKAETLPPEIPAAVPGPQPPAALIGAEIQILPKPGPTQPEATEPGPPPQAPRPEIGIVATDQATGVVASTPPAVKAVAAPRATRRLAEAPATPDVAYASAQPATAPGRAEKPAAAPAEAPAPIAAMTPATMATAAEAQPLTTHQFAAAPPQGRAPQPAPEFPDRPATVWPDLQPAPPAPLSRAESQPATMNLAAPPDTAPRAAQHDAEEKPLSPAAPTKAIKIEAENPKALSPAPISPVPISAAPISLGAVAQNAGTATANPAGTNLAPAVIATPAAAGMIAAAPPQPRTVARGLGETVRTAVEPQPRAGGGQSLRAARPEVQSDTPLPEAPLPAAAPPLLPPAAPQAAIAAAPLPMPASAAMPSELALPLAPLETERPEWQADLVSRITSRIEEQGAVFDIALTPETLGSVEVRLELRDGKADVTFVTETREAARLLAQSEAKLGELLARSGVSLNSQDASARDQSQSQPRPDRLPMSRAGKQDETPAAAQATTRRSGLNLIA